VTDNNQPKTYDLKGRVITVKVGELQSYVPSADYTTRVGEVTYKLMKEAEEKFNCKFEFEVIPKWATVNNDFLTYTLAGLVYADVVRLQRSVIFPSYEKQNVLLPLNDYIDFNQPVYKKFDQINGILYPENIYGFFNGTPLTPIGIFYNREVLYRDGIPDLHEYAANGIWNWNTFLDICIKTTHDYNGDGIIDQWGIGSPNAQYTSICMLRSNLQPIIAWAGGSNYVYNLQNHKALKVLQFITEMYNTYNVVNKNGEADFLKGKVAMFFREAWYGEMLINNGMRNLGFEELPVGPDNPGRAFMREQGSNFFFFPSTLKDPEGVVNAVAHWNVIWDDTKSEYVTLEDMVLSQAQVYFDSETEINRFMEMMNYKVEYDYIDYFSPSKTRITSRVFDEIAKDQISTASAVESVKNEVEAIINDKMSK